MNEKNVNKKKAHEKTAHQKEVSEQNAHEEKLWESTYAVRNHPRFGPYMHAAGMVERTTGVTHYWLVRGPCTQSVVRELQEQLVNAYRGKAIVSPKGKTLGSLVAERTAAETTDHAADQTASNAPQRSLPLGLLAGICGLALGALTGK